MLRRIAISTLAIYIVFILLNTLIQREVYVGEQYNFKLFWTYIEIAKGGGRARRLIFEIITNILMTIPIGFLLPVANEKLSIPKIILIGILFSLFIELLQLFLHKGLCEIDDVIHNTLGVILGYGFYSVINRLKKRWSDNAD